MSERVRVPRERSLRHAEQLGRERGREAGSWAFDGNSTREAAIRFLVGIEVGDPEVTDALHEMMPTLSGEWADDLTPALLYEACTGKSLEDYYEANPDDDSDWATAAWFQSELCDRWEEGARRGLEESASEEAMAVLGAEVRMRATFDRWEWVEGEEEPHERGGWVDPHNPWGSFEIDAAADVPVPTARFSNLWDAASFALQFPGGIWDYSESEGKWDYRAGAWKSVTLHVDQDSEPAVFEVLDAMRKAGLR